MSQFCASIQGSRGEATRQGHKNSGIRGHIRGWDFGIKVVGFVNANGEEVFEVFKTGGSNGSNSMELIVRFVDGEENKV